MSDCDCDHYVYGDICATLGHLGTSGFYRKVTGVRGILPGSYMDIFNCDRRFAYISHGTYITECKHIANLTRERGSARLSERRL